MRLFTVAAVVAAAACAANPSPVPIAGTARDLDALAGAWEGEYVSGETGRSGNITFTLRAGADSAFGDVVMIPRPVPPIPADGRVPPGGVIDAPHVLSIAFVRAGTGVVSGRLTPYQSPDCGCTLTTVFRGTVSGDRIEGTFTMIHSDHMAPQQTGTWWVARRSASRR